MFIQCLCFYECLTDRKYIKSSELDTCKGDDATSGTNKRLVLVVPESLL